jgi:hypothetical protein
VIQRYPSDLKIGRLKHDDVSTLSRARHPLARGFRGFAVSSGHDVPPDWQVRGRCGFGVGKHSAQGEPGGEQDEQDV